MLDVVQEEWSIACDGDEMDMANWAIRWGNPLMGSLARRVLIGELVEENKALREALTEIKNDVCHCCGAWHIAEKALDNHCESETCATDHDDDGTGYCRGCGTTIGEPHHTNCTENAFVSLANLMDNRANAADINCNCGGQCDNCRAVEAVNSAAEILLDALSKRDE